jgi:hypothetical protein
MEISEEEITKTPVEETISVTKVNNFLRAVGLETPLDYLFLDHAMNMHQTAIMKNKDISLQFLFQLMIGKEDKDLNFPYSSFLEKINFRYADPDADVLTMRETPRYIVSHLIPSERWHERKPQSFSDFHLYYLDVIKPMTKQSAEEIYALLDSKKDETFFLVFGDRKIDPFLIVLFVFKKLITTFHITPFECQLTDKGGVCKWIHSEIPTFQRQVTEYGMFELPENNLVLTEKGIQLRKQQWKEAFGDPDYMDREDIPDLVSSILEDSEVCENCSA